MQTHVLNWIWKRNVRLDKVGRCGVGGTQIFSFVPFWFGRKTDTSNQWREAFTVVSN